MTSVWRETLAKVDAEAATVLPENRPRLSSSFTCSGDEPAREWLGRQFPGPNVIIVPGASQAGWVLPLLRSKKSLTVLLLDQNTERLVDALDFIECQEPVALAEMLESKRLIIDPGESKEKSTDRFLQAADFSRRPCIRVLDAEDVSDADYKMTMDVTEPARELIRYQACDLATRMRFGAEWQEQGICNIPAMVQHAGVRSLFGSCKGLPAIVIGAGPSSWAMVERLKLLYDRFVVICVGRAISFCAYNQIPFHLAVSGDGQSFVQKHFLKKPAGVPVVASFFTDPDTISSLDRVFFCEMESMNLPVWLQQKVGNLGELFPGGNVSTAAMSLAVEMGCNPVYTVGVDFCFSGDGRTHATKKIDPDYGGQKLYTVPGNYQETVKTNRQMYHYIDFTSEWISRNPGTTFINVNNGGARIEGMELLRPYRFPEVAGSTVIFDDVEQRIDVAYTGDKRSKDADGCIASLQDDLPLLQSLQRECKDAAMICNQLIMLMRRPGMLSDPEEQLRELLAKLSPLDERIKDDDVMNLLEARLEGAMHMLSERMMSVQERSLSPSVRAHKRWREFYMQVADACRDTEELLQTAISELIENQGNGDGMSPAIPDYLEEKTA